MTGEQILDDIQRAGLTVEIVDNRIRLAGPAELRALFRQTVREHKLSLVAAIQSRPLSSQQTSARWLLTFASDIRVEAYTSPASTQAEIMAQFPDAIAATPIVPPPLRSSCETCAKVTGMGACGDPVGAGLTDMPDVTICYHPDGGVSCRLWAATTPNLEKP